MMYTQEVISIFIYKLAIYKRTRLLGHTVIVRTSSFHISLRFISNVPYKLMNSFENGKLVNYFTTFLNFTHIMYMINYFVTCNKNKFSL